MGIKITNLEEVVMALKLTDRNVTEEAREAVKRGAKAIQKTAQEFAPVDEHRLEQAIHVLPFRGNQYSLNVVIEVGGVVNGRDVSTYAAIVHEYEWRKRGPKTRAKGPRAGPRYLRRALEARRAEILEAVKKAMQDGISKAIRTSGVNRSTKRRRR